MNAKEIKRKSFIEGVLNPNAFVVIFLLIVLCAILTWIIPSGQYDRIKDINSGRTIVQADSFKYIETHNVGLFEMLKAIPKGINDSMGIIGFIFLISGAIQVIKATKAFDAGIYCLIKKAKGNGNLLIIVVSFLFSLLGSVFGFAEETIPFIPLGVTLAVAMGYDRLVGFDMVRVAAWVGFAGAFLNPFTIGVAQSIAELPLFSGMGYRIICYIIFYLTSLLFILSYAKKVKDDPTKSHLYQYKGNHEEGAFSLSEDISLTKRQILVLLVFLVTLVLLVYGVIKYEWYVTELSALFVGCGIIAGLVGGLSPNELARQYCRGMADVISAAIVVGLARTMVVILENGQVLDTIVHAITTPIAYVGSSITLVVMFISHSFINFFIGSGSGQAAATMPIMIPIGDILNISRQSQVLAFQFGDGITNMIYPSMIYFLPFADIPYSIWVKHIFKLVVILSIIAAILIAISGVINYGPF